MIIQDDILHWAETYEGEPFHAMLLDPPYHLTPQFNRWSKATSLGKTKDVFARQARGMMGQTWDGGDLAFRPETWAALAQHLYPGAFIMAFASSRGWHRMAVAMEDAGLILHPSLFMFGWCYLSGFPKATRIDTQIDRANGNIRPDKLNGGHIGMGVAAGDGDNENELHNQIPHIIGKGNHSNGTPIDPLAQAWAGHRYGGQMIKPAIEPIIVAQVPYQGRPIENIVETGVGALWIDGGRIPINNDEDLSRQNGGTEVLSWGGTYGSGNNEAAKRRVEGLPAQGRWPSNLVIHCSCSPTRPDKSIHDESCAVAVLDGQSGESTSTGGTNPNPSSIGGNGIYGGGKEWAYSHYDDSGPASRMFYTSDWAYEVAEQLAAADSIRYEPKASSTEREIGLDGLETQTRHRMRPDADPDKLTGLNTEPRFAPTQVKNIHPTVKPISLTKYLATLLLPPAQYAPRRILIPFCGVASEYIGAMLAGWEEIVGIERESNYVEIARERVKWWSQWPGWGQTDVDKILANDEGEQQLRMF